MIATDRRPRVAARAPRGRARRRPLPPRRPLRPRRLRVRPPARAPSSSTWTPSSPRTAPTRRAAATRCRRRRRSRPTWPHSGSATTTSSWPTTTRAAMMAARLVWMLRATGHEAALLDGGLGAWDGPARDARRPTRPPARFSARDVRGRGLDRRRRRLRQRRRRRAPARALPRRAAPAGHPLGPHPRRPQPPVPRAPVRGRPSARARRPAIASWRTSGSTAKRLSCPTAAQASPPATTCS